MAGASLDSKYPMKVLPALRPACRLMVCVLPNSSLMLSLRQRERVWALFGRGQVLYCGACTNPPEYCGWTGNKVGVVDEACKAWLLANEPAMAAKFGYTSSEGGGEAAAAGGEPEKKKGGGKKEAVKEVLVSSKQRQKKKFVCTVRGLEGFGIKLPDACKVFKKKFSTGASVTETPDQKEEIEIQGDVKDDVVPLIVKEFGIQIEDIFFQEGTGLKITKIKAADVLGGDMQVGR